MAPKHPLFLLPLLLLVVALICADARLHEEDHLKRRSLIQQYEAENEKKPFLEKKPPHLEKPVPPPGHGLADHKKPVGTGPTKPFREKKPPIALKPVPPPGHGPPKMKPKGRRGDKEPPRV